MRQNENSLPMIYPVKTAKQIIRNSMITAEQANENIFRHFACLIKIRYCSFVSELIMNSTIQVN